MVRVMSQVVFRHGCHIWCFRWFGNLMKHIPLFFQIVLHFTEVRRAQGQLAIRYSPGLLMGPTTKIYEQEGPIKYHENVMNTKFETIFGRKTWELREKLVNTTIIHLLRWWNYDMGDQKGKSRETKKKENEENAKHDTLVSSPRVILVQYSCLFSTLFHSLYTKTISIPAQALLHRSKTFFPTYSYCPRYFPVSPTPISPSSTYKHPRIPTPYLFIRKPRNPSPN